MRKFALASIVGLVLSIGALAARPVVSTPGKPAATTRATTQKAAQTRPAEVKPGVSAARGLYWSGKYAEAEAMYRRLLDSPDGLVASIGLAEVCGMTGRYEAALAALDGAKARGAKDAAWHVAASGAQAAVGKYDEALASARKAVELRDDWAPAALCLGQALERFGKKAEAMEAYKRVDKAIARTGFTHDAPSLLAAGKVMDRLAILAGQRASDQAQNILDNYLQRAYLHVDKTYWPANLATAEFLISKHKLGPAAKEFALAEKLNPLLPEVSVGRAVLVLRQWQFEQALSQADKALKINPNHPDALLVKAATYMRWRKFDQAAPLIEQVLKVNPNHFDALSMLAALHVRQQEPDKAAAFVARVEKINPRCAELYETIGEWLGAERQFDEAEKYFRKAIELSPELAGPVTSLGVMYMQTGEEALAKTTLEKAMGIDNYRADVLEYLRLLDEMEKYQVKETEHFIIKVDPKHDAVLLDWVAEEAERIYKEVTRDFDHEPKKKTILELFPQHRGFSVRITGKGWIGTVGACTGRVIAMPAPDPERGQFGRFSWSVVLRHEFTHTVTLSATRNRIPHWFTEACAVWEQPDRRNFMAVQLLLDAVRKKRLFPIHELAWGFIRPTPGGSRSLAYAQSEWIFEHIVEKKGYETIIKMLKGFGEGWPQEKVFKEVLGCTEKEFDKDFAAWAVEQVRAWGYDPDPAPTVAEATAAVQKDPKSADAQAALAVALVNARQYPQAEAAARKALDIDPNNKRALGAAGYSLAQRKQYDQAIAHAQRLEEVDPRSALAARVLAECCLAQRKWFPAIKALEDYKGRRPQDDFGYIQLEKLYMQLGQTDKALPNLIELHRRTMKDATYARRIADIYRTSPTPEKALDFYEQVIHINPYDAGVYKAMASLYLRHESHERAIRAMRSACLLEPKNADYLAQLAMVYLRVADKTRSPQRLSEARQAAEEALKLDPQCQAREVLQMIDAAEKTQP